MTSDLRNLVDTDAERAIVAGLLWRGDATRAVIRGAVDAGDFSDPKLAATFTAACALIDAGTPANPMTVMSELVRTGQTSRGVTLAMLMDVQHAGTVLASEFHARCLAELSRARKLVSATDRAVRGVMAGGMTAAEYIEAVAAAAKGSARPNDRERHQAGDVAATIIAELDAPAAAAKSWPMPLRELRALIPKLHAGGVYILSATEKTGKTALASQMAIRVAQSGERAVFCSLEMDERRLVRRQLAQLSDVPILDIHPRMSGENRGAVELAQQELSMLDIEIINMRGRHGVDDVIGALTAAVHVRPAAVAFVDHVQRLTAGGRRKENRNQELEDISRALSSWAQKNECALVVLSQVNASGETRDSKAMQQDAEAVVLLEKSTDNAREVAVTVRMQREGDTGSFPIAFDGPTLRFGSWR